MGKGQNKGVLKLEPENRDCLNTSIFDLNLSNTDERSRQNALNTGNFKSAKPQNS